MDATNGQGNCRHSGYHSGVGLYSKDEQEIRYVLVCDECGDEVQLIETVPYSPDPVFEAA